MRRLPFLLAIAATSAQAQSGSTYVSASEGAAIRAAAARTPAMARALERARATMADALARPMDVPQPGEAGGYAHERHKQNYREMQLAGALYRITGERRYATFVRDMLEKYAVLYPTLGPHPLAKDQAPGKLFHQALNEANWLLATAIAYDCVKATFTPAERARYETTVLRPMADWLSVKEAKEFDRIHNHGTWATAAVGTLGFAIGDTSYVNRALYGTTRNGTGGFLKQLDLLFSPDGYYMEGPYYVRYALLPFFQFAEAVERNRPAVRIYAYRDSILKKAIYSALATTYPNGVFAPINDASRTMSLVAPEVVTALDYAYARYGADRNLLGAAALQGDVLLNGAGLAVARDLARGPAPAVAWKSTEFTDGPDGTKGGLGILRTGSGADATMLLMKYGVHGQGHGHFDKLTFTFYDGGQEVVPDYGFARWINIEPKSGGRYLPENDSWAKQTVAHNTVVVDGRSQSDGNYPADEQKAAQRHFFDASNPRVQVVSARADGFHDGVGMQRTMLLLRDARLRWPVVVDVYRLTSGAEHAYDYPLHFRGQLVNVNAKLDVATTERRALGTRAGYQHLFGEATARTDSTLQVTWLAGSRYYTASIAAGPGAELTLARTGAADPNFNLIVEPMLLVRRRAADQTFATVLEPHGYFSELEERSADARPAIRSVRVVASTDEGTIVEIAGRDDLRWTVMVTNGPADARRPHRMQVDGRSYGWTGNSWVIGLR